MNVLYYGHACFLVTISGVKLLFDPFISPLGKEVDIDAIRPDYILVTHGHEDHVTDLVSISRSSGAKVVSSWEIHNWLQNQGITNTHPMNTGGSWQFDFGTVKCVVAQHSSSLPDGTYAGNPMGFVIETPEICFYYAGDTALTLDMQLIPKRYKLDIAFLPIGNNFTMDTTDAIIASEFIACKRIIPMHYNTFGFIVVDMPVARAAFASAGCVVEWIEPGQAREISR